jgi:hypothetical protein
LGDDAAIILSTFHRLIKFFNSSYFKFKKGLDKNVTVLRSNSMEKKYYAESIFYIYSTLHCQKFHFVFLTFSNFLEFVKNFYWGEEKLGLGLGVKFGMWYSKVVSTSAYTKKVPDLNLESTAMGKRRAPL